MGSLRTYVLIFIVAFAAVSCEDVVQVKLDEGSRLIVIDAFVNDLPQPQVIRVCYNDAYFGNTEAPPVTGARVSLRDIGSGDVFDFTDEGAGNHVFRAGTGDTLLRMGHQYELRVLVDGYTYTALATKKRTAVIRDIDTNYVSGQGGFGGPPGDPFYFCELKAKDTVDANTDYYWVKTFRNDSLLFTPSDMGFAFSIDGTNGPVTTADADTTNFTPPATFLGFRQFHSGDKCGVQIHSISRECYLFFVQAGQQVNNAGLFATTPENVRTNIVTPTDAPLKGVGWFNVASVAEKTRIIP